MERAHLVLCHRLGLLNEADDHPPITEALAKYMAMFDGPLPTHVIVALAALFDIDDEVTGHMDGVMIELAREGVADLPDVAESAAA